MRIHADLGVKIPALIADFAHIAKHQQLASRRTCEHVDGGAHRIGIGVIGIVDQQRALPTALDLQPALYRGESGQRADAGFQRGAGGRGRCNGGQCIARVVFTCNRQI